MPKDPPLIYARCLEPGRQTPVDGELVVMATVIAGGKIRVEIHVDGELAARIRKGSGAANRAKLQGRQRPRPG